MRLITEWQGLRGVARLGPCEVALELAENAKDTSLRQNQAWYWTVRHPPGVTTVIIADGYSPSQSAARKSAAVAAGRAMRNA